MWGRRSSTRRKRRAIPKSVKDAVRQRDGNACRKCGGTENLQFDHIKPVSRGGKNAARNLQILCGLHNREKGVSRRYKVNPPPKQRKVRATGRARVSSDQHKGWFGNLFGA